MTLDARPPTVSTPCVRLCSLDATSGLCLGCGRSLDEIGRWSGLDEPTRRAIMVMLPGRLAAIAADLPCVQASS